MVISMILTSGLSIFYIKHISNHDHDIGVSSRVYHEKNIKTNDRLNLLRWSAGVHLRMFLLKVQMDPQSKVLTTTLKTNK
jgi:hypothetical protein